MAQGFGNGKIIWRWQNIWGWQNIWRWQNDLRVAERSGDDRTSRRSSVSPHHNLYLEVPWEFRRIWKCPRPCVRWAVSEVSGILCALLIKSQSVEEIPGNPSLEQLSHIHPRPSVVRRTLVAVIFHTSARGGGMALLMPANPFLL